LYNTCITLRLESLRETHFTFRIPLSKETYLYVSKETYLFVSLTLGPARSTGNLDFLSRESRLFVLFVPDKKMVVIWRNICTPPLIAH